MVTLRVTIKGSALACLCLAQDQGSFYAQLKSYAQPKGAYCFFQIEDLLVKIFDLKKAVCAFWLRIGEYIACKAL